MIKNKGKSLFLLAIALTVLALSCGGSDVVGGDESSEGQAIGNIISIDRPEECNLDFLNFSIPDTSSFLTDSQKYLFWMNGLWDSLFVTITHYDTIYPDDPNIPILRAKVRIDKKSGIIFEFMGKDIADGETTLVRYSKPAEIDAHVAAYFLKYGMNHNFRRGWLLGSVGHAHLGSGYSIDTLGQNIILESVNYGIIVNNLFQEPFDLSLTPRLYQGDSIFVFIESENEHILSRIKYPGPTGYLYGEALYDTAAHKYYLGFRVPNVIIKGHIIIEQYSRESLMDPQDVLRFGLAGILFKTY